VITHKSLRNDVPFMSFHGDPAGTASSSKEFGYITILDELSIKLEMPVGIIKGEKPGPTLLITGGLLGTEYCGIEAASRIYSTLSPQRLQGTVVVIPVVNMACFSFRVPWFTLQNSLTPFDGMHLNRCFPGNKNGKPSERLAYRLFHDYVLKSDFHVDFRGGDLHESHIEHTITSVTGENIDEKCIELAKAWGLRYVLPRPCTNSSGTLIYETVKKGVPSIISESGIGYRTQPMEKYIQYHVDGANNLLKYLGMLSGEPLKPEYQRFFYDSAKVKTPASGVFHAYVDQGELVTENQIIGKITGLDNGVKAEIISPIDGIVHEMMPRRLVYIGDTVYSLCEIGEPTGWVNP